MKTTHSLLLCVFMISNSFITTSCGVKGPPLPPLAVVPQQVSERSESSALPNSPASPKSGRDLPPAQKNQEGKNDSI